MTNCIFTIISKNYLGLAIALGGSIKKYNREANYFIFCADEIGERKQLENEFPIIYCKDVLVSKNFNWDHESFIYDVTEFCTFLKPHCFLHLIESGYDKIIYLDPDIKVFDSLQPVFDKLDSYSVVVNPVITEPFTVAKDAALNESLMMSNGLFCLGFAGFNNSAFAIKMLEWWKEKLKYECFVSKPKTQFTDQKWADFFIPFGGNEQVFVDMDLGYNVAYWNIHYRRLINKEGKYFIQNEYDNSVITPLRFVHFSGFSFESISGNNGFGEKILLKYPDYAGLVIQYYEDIAIFGKYSKLGYTYKTLSDDSVIMKRYRRIFYELIKGNNQQLINTNPFDASGPYVTLLKKKKLFQYEKDHDGKPEIVLSPIINNTETVNKKTRMLYKVVGLCIRIIGLRKFYKLSHYLGRLKDDDFLTQYMQH